MENIKQEETSDDETTTKNESSKAAAIEKGIRFWTHPSLSNISADKKIQYLKSRGLSEQDVHTIWERLAEKEENVDGNAAQQQDTVANNTTIPPANPTMNAQPYPPPPQQQQDPPLAASPQQQYYYSQYPQQQDESTTAMDIPVLLAVGSALGLTAAAAVRWLNGGDFVLFPPATTQDTNDGVRNVATSNEHERVLSITSEEEDLQEEEEEDDGICNENDHDEELQQQSDMKDVIQLLESHCEKQDQVLHQISHHFTKQVTDQSMNLLRNHSSTNNNTMEQELQSIKVELQALSQEDTIKDNTEWKDKLEQCLTQLQECLTRVSSSTPLLNQVNSSTTTSSTQFSSGSSSSVFTPTYGGTVAVKTPLATTSSNDKSLRQAITMLAQENEATALRAGAQILYLYVINLSSHTHVPRYRKIFTTNESFKKVNQLQGGTDLLLAVGFEKKGNCYEWQGGEKEELALKEAAAALSILKSQHENSNKHLAESALAILPSRPSTPPPAPSMTSSSALTTPIFIASPPTTKKHPLLGDESLMMDEGSILDISNASEHFESRLESLAQPVIGGENDVMFSPQQINLSMRSNNDDENDSVETKRVDDQGEGGKEANTGEGFDKSVSTTSNGEQKDDRDER